MKDKASVPSSALRTIREFYGLSQKEVAIFFGVTSNHYSNLETKRRAPNTEVIGKQLLLEPALLPPMDADLQKEIAAELQRQETEKAAARKENLFAANKRLRGLEASLQTCKTRYQQGVNVLRAVKKTLSQLPPDDGAARHVMLSVQSGAWIKVKENGPLAQHRLEEEIAFLTEKIAKWERDQADQGL